MASAIDLWEGGFSDTDLFSRKVGSETHSLDELVERSLNGSPADALESEYLAALPDSPHSGAENVEVVPCCGAAATATQRRIAPKILKKKSTLNVRRLNPLKQLKKVTFEVEKLVADEAYTGADQQDVRARMAIRLGAKPLTPTFVNYKQLKVDRAVAKVQDKEKKATELQMKPKLSKKKMPKKGAKKAE